MIQRELIEQGNIFRQITIPDGVGGHTSLFVFENTISNVNVYAIRQYLQSGEHC